MFCFCFYLKNLFLKYSLYFGIKILGWSCSICEDLRVLLSFEELSETNVINEIVIFQLFYFFVFISKLDMDTINR